MLIKQDKKSTGLLKGLGDFARAFFQKKRAKAIVIIGLFFVGVFSGIVYGANLYRTYQIFSIYDLAKGIATENLKIPMNYVNGLMSDPRVVVIDMKNNDFQHLAYLRGLALDSGKTVIGDEIKDVTVPGRIRFFGEDKGDKAEFSLTGQNFDHIADENRWSLRVKVKGDNVLGGMKKFTLVLPETRARGSVSEWINHQLEKSLGLISLRYEFVRVVVNGKDLGIYALEEHFDKRMLENNGHREGLIVQARHDGRLKVFGSGKVDSNPALLKQWNHLQTLWKGFRTGEVKTEQIFSVDELAKYYAMADVVNGQHSHFIGNEFFYFNPITRLLQPVGREWSSPYKKMNDFGLFIQTLDAGATMSTASPQTVTSLHKQVFSSSEFVAAYFKELRLMSSDTFMDGFLDSIADELAETKGILFSEYPHLNMSEDYLYVTQGFIFNYLNANHADKLVGYMTTELGKQGTLTLENRAPFPMEISALLVNEDRVTLDVDLAAFSVKTIDIPNVPKNLSDAKLELIFAVPGLQSGYTTRVFPWGPDEGSAVNTYPLIDGGDDIAAQQGDNYVLSNPGGTLQISSNLIVPAGKTLRVNAGTSLDIIKGATIVSYGPVHFEGTSDQPINVFSSDETGQGLIVLGAPRKSILKHTKFEGMRSYQSSTWSVSAAVLFYESDVEIFNGTFANNKSEDGLNIVRSKFEIKDSLFQGTQSDAFDSDFSSGTVDATKYVDLGNDAIDTSGSQLTIANIHIIAAGDKALSIGERSTMVGAGIIIEDSAVAVTAKDSSIFTLSDLAIESSDVAFALYNKKPEFGVASGDVTNLTLRGAKKDHLIQVGSQLSLDNKIIKGDLADVEELMYGAVYGRATKK